MNPTTQTYTPAGGLTPQAQALQGQQDILSQITGMAKNAGSDPTSAIQGAFSNAAAAAQPAQVQQATQQLTQQAGIPALQNQQGDLGKIFQMYLSDNNLSQKYSSPSLGTPNSQMYNSGLQNSPQAMQGLFAGYQNQVANPYLASPTAIVNALSQPSGQGFQGFSTPTGNTGAMTQVPTAANSLISGLQGLISNETSLVNSKAQDYTTGYQNIMNGIGNLLGNQATTAFAQTQPGTPAANQKLENSIQQDIKNGMTLQQALLKYRSQTDPNSIYGIYNTVHSSDKPGTKGSAGWGTAKESAQELANLGITGAPVTQAANSQKQTGKKYQLKTIGSKQYNYDSSTGTIYDLSGNKVDTSVATGAAELQDKFDKLKTAWNAYVKAPTPESYKNYNTQKQTLGDSLYYQLTKSRAFQGMQRMIDKMPNPNNPIDMYAGGAEGSFTGFENQLNLTLDGSKTAATNTGGNRQAVVDKLKQSGYNDNQIHEYLRTKGIDK